MCTKQLERATELIGGLGGEGERWFEAAEKLGEVYETLTGELKSAFDELKTYFVSLQAMSSSHPVLFLISALLQGNLELNKCKNGVINASH
jgi:hypothetical protein